MIRRPEDRPTQVPDAPRPVPKWFFMRRMWAMAFCGLLLTILGLAFGIGLPVFFYISSGGILPTVDLSLDRDHASAEAVITDKDYMRYTNINNRHPWRVSFRFTTPEGANADAVGYTLDRSFADREVGDTIDVEYDPDDPSLARPVGGSAAMPPLIVYLLVFAILVPEVIIGIILLMLTWTRARSEHLLLAHGQGADAEVVAVKKVWHISVGTKRPFDVYYQFTGSLGRKVTGRDRTYHYAWAEALKPGEKVGVVYHPQAPEVNVLWLHGRDVAQGE